MIMIGDRIDTDMLISHNAGIDGCLVLTGVTQGQSEMEEKMIKDARIRPKYFMQSLGLIDDSYLK